MYSYNNNAATSRLKISVLIALLTIACWSRPLWAEKYGVLIGVGDYQHDDGQYFKDLAGPSYDIAALKKVALETWGIPAENLTVLQDSKATKAGVLASIARLSDVTQPGDSVLIYFSGHGTSSKDIDPSTGQSAINLPDGTGALVPYDFAPWKKNGKANSPDELARQLVVGRRDIRPLLTRLDQNQVHVWMIVDACYSGNAVRSAYNTRAGGTRYLNVKGMLRLSGSKVSATRSMADKTGVYPYKNVVFYAAASETELARDMPPNETLDGKPHGAFTDSILRVARERSLGTYSYEAFFDDIESSMEEFCGCQHTPNLLPREIATVKPELQQKLLNNARYSPPAVTQPVVTPPAPQPQVLPGFTVALDDNAAEYRAALESVAIASTGNRESVRLRFHGGSLVALSNNGDLIYKWQEKPSIASVNQWLKVRKWLKQRISVDKANNPTVKFVVREGMTGKALQEDSELYFSLSLDKTGRLLLLDVRGDGRVSIVYPYYSSELSALPANQRITIPAEEHPIIVEAPFGTDTLLLYRLSNSVGDQALIKQFQGFRDSVLEYDSPLMKKLEKRLAEGGLGAANMKFVTYKAE